MAIFHLGADGHSGAQEKVAVADVGDSVSADFWVKTCEDPKMLKVFLFPFLVTSLQRFSFWGPNNSNLMVDSRNQIRARHRKGGR